MAKKLLQWFLECALIVWLKVHFPDDAAACFCSQALISGYHDIIYFGKKMIYGKYIIDHYLRQVTVSTTFTGSLASSSAEHAS